MKVQPPSPLTPLPSRYATCSYSLLFSLSFLPPSLRPPFPFLVLSGAFSLSGPSLPALQPPTLPGSGHPRWDTDGRGEDLLNLSLCYLSLPLSLAPIAAPHSLLSPCLPPPLVDVVLSLTMLMLVRGFEVGWLWGCFQGLVLHLFFSSVAPLSYVGTVWIQNLLTHSSFHRCTLSLLYLRCEF